MNTLTHKRILLGVTGGIAAYKSAELIRQLKENGADVRVVMTPAAKEFITPLTLQALSGHIVYEQLFDAQTAAAMSHIELARWAEWIVIAPASADFLAKLAYGHANDLLSTLCLATQAPIVVAPAMNQQMWLNACTQENVRRLIAHGIHVLEVAEGSQACGETGPGRMLEPEIIMQKLQQRIMPAFLSGTKILITAGPTQESIDPVRYISNRSSGKMGYALAEAAVAAGAEVTLISGPVHLATPPKVQRIDVKTAEQMQQAVLTKVKDCAIFISVAAVADYRCAIPQAHKMPKDQLSFHLELVRNTDILSSVTSLPNPPFTVGFAAETANLLENAKNKLRKKQLNMIVVNSVNEQLNFNADDNEVTVLWPKGEKHFARTTKKRLAFNLMELIAEHYAVTAGKVAQL